MLLVGEAWGEAEETCRQPFVGWSGQELWRMLGEAAPEVAPDAHTSALHAQRYGHAWIRQREDWLSAASCALTNVFNIHPLANKLEYLCVGKSEGGGIAPSPSLPILRQPRALYLHSRYLPELFRLRSEISLSKPNLIVALGATASWALLCATNIGSIRGTVAASSPIWEAGNVQGEVGGEAEAFPKILPTYHPAGVLRNYSWRPVVVADLVKAFREAQFPEICRPRREILVNPTKSEMTTWTAATLASPPPLLSCDIETKSGQITCIGFARSTSEAMVIPFVDLSAANKSYWPALSDEVLAWECCKALLVSPSCALVGQNFIYDLQYLTSLGLRPNALTHDTMLLHHSLHPEVRKGLGFLGSIYTNEASWKLMRKRKDENETNKADD